MIEVWTIIVLCICLGLACVRLWTLSQECNRLERHWSRVSQDLRNEKLSMSMTASQLLKEVDMLWNEKTERDRKDILIQYMTHAMLLSNGEIK